MRTNGTTMAHRMCAPTVIDLDDECAQWPELVGAKAAALARARVAGLPALGGFAITTSGTGRDGAAVPVDDERLQTAWRTLSDSGRLPLVVRSSSTVEDGGSSSMAGLFASVLDVRDWDAFLDAARTVVRSGDGAPIAVLVQRFIEPAWGGVLFGADPVTGRTDRLVVAAVPGGPDRLVSGQVDGSTLTLSRRGRLRDADDGAPDALRRRSLRRALVRLASRAAATFGGPQDIEWAIGHDGTVVLLQSRPITAIGGEVLATGPVLGPGPVAETFGLPLRPLEEDLWVTPLREGIREALAITGATSARRRRESPIVITVGGHVAADLDLLGVTGTRRSLWAKLDPRPPYRRLKAAWRVGRLRVALPALAGDLIDDVDADLRSIPPLDTLTSVQRARMLTRSGQTLTALHGHEVLAGLLLDVGDQRRTAAADALRLLREVAVSNELRRDEDLVAEHPVLLSLVPPAIGVTIELPPAPSAPPPAPIPASVDDPATRESLRLRIRWLHELTARLATTLGDDLVARGVLADAATVAELRLDDLRSALEPGATASRIVVRSRVPGPALPATFRLSDEGTVVPVGRGSDGRGAGGGRGSGPVHVGTEQLPSPGDVLVVRTLDPALASLLPGLAGLVAETGSVLSHLAILAREYGVPTVVGMQGATERFEPGASVVVDGTTGDVTSAWPVTPIPSETVAPVRTIPHVEEVSHGRAS